jgi:hypothetical protein
MNTDGSGQVNLANRLGSDFCSTWSLSMPRKWVVFLPLVFRNY